MGVAADRLAGLVSSVFMWCPWGNESVHSVLQIREIIFESVGHVVPAEEDGRHACLGEWTPVLAGQVSSTSAQKSRHRCGCRCSCSRARRVGPGPSFALIRSGFVSEDVRRIG